PVDGAHDAGLARLFGDFLHVASHARVGAVVVLDDLLGLLARDADALREAERLDGVGDGEVNDLGEAPLLLQLLPGARAEDEAGRALVYVLALLEGVEHLRVLRDVRQQTQLKLRVVRRDEDVPTVGDEGAADAPTEFRADGDVLQVRLRTAEPSRRRHGLVELAVDAPVRADERRQGVRVGRLELVQLSELDEEARQLVPLRGQLVEHGAARRDLARGGLAVRADVQLFEHFADLLRRVDLELAPGQLVNLPRQLFKLRAEEGRQLAEHGRVNAQARALGAVEQGRDGDF